MNLLPFFAFITLTAASSFPLERSLNPQPKAASENYRLPTHAYPVHYDLTLEPNFSDFSFAGEASIELEVTEEVSNITLHAYNLTVSVENVTFGDVEVESVDYDEDYQFLIIHLGTNVSQGSYVLNITYEGYLNTNNRGFYRGNYQNSDGETRWFATTKFEPAYARYAFPCFDEPGLKAEFTISTIRSSNYSSISNMNFNYSSTLAEGQVKDTFERSVKMSTYLVAFIVSDFANVSKDNHSVFAREDLIEEGRGEYGLQIGINALNSLVEYTNVSYPIDKMYQVGLPDDWFPSGAMENWGIVTYKERYLLYKENTTTSSEKQTITTIIAHEFAHQWFGNLVTPSWWIYIWLNEGFATYFEYYAASLVQPTWRLMDQMLIKSVQYALESDSSTSTRPMSTDAGSPTEISALFDVVIYDKAGAIIRMMEHIVTTQVYKESLSIYLKNRIYDVVEPSHLWSSVQAALDASNITGVLPSGATVEDVMETWNTQSGYPLITAERNYEDGSVSFSQNRFILSGSTDGYNETYWVPINFATTDNPDFEDTNATLWLTSSSLSYNASLGNFSWIIVNKQQTGYYRVNYDTNNWKLIINHLKNTNFEDIHVLNRAQLLDDAFNLARSGRLSYSILFELLEYITEETDYVPLYAVSRGLTYLDRFISGTDYYNEFQEFFTEMLKKAFEKLGADLITDEPITDVFNRINIIKWMCLYDGSNCREALNEKLLSRSFVHPDLQDPVYCGGMRQGSDDDWDYLYQLYVSDDTEERQKSRLLAALGCSLNQTILERLLNSTLGLEPNYTFRSSDVTTAFSAAYTGSYVGVETSFQFVLERFEDITNSFSTSQVSTILSGISLRLSTSDHYQKLQEFIASQSAEVNATFSSAFSTALNNINSNLAWYDRSFSAISSYFEDDDNGDDTSTSTSSSSTSDATTTSATTTTTTTTSTTTTSAPATSTAETTTAASDSSDSARLSNISISLLFICLFATSIKRI